MTSKTSHTLDTSVTEAQEVEMSKSTVTEDVAQGSRLKLLICFLGIFVCYFYYGILQEKITRGTYGEGENQETFTYTLALVFVQCIINGIFAKGVLTLTSPGTDSTPWTLYSTCAMSYLGAMVASNWALRHVNYPTQVLGKSCKPIPVMILGVLISRKRYNLAKYLCVLLIVAGVSLFLYKDNGKSSKSEGESLFGIGEALLLVSLTLDGVTGAIQDRMRGDHKTGSHYMMFNMNLWSMLYLAISLVVTGEGLRFISFVSRYPWVMFNIVMFGLTSAMGQSFIFTTVAVYGSLVCSLITTNRKFITILFSIFFMGNPLTKRQFLGVFMVFSGLFLNNHFGKSYTVDKKKIA